VCVCRTCVYASVSKRPMVFGKSVNPSVQRSIMANDHESSSNNSTSKYFQPRWCPPGLTRTQKRKLQRFCIREKKEMGVRMRKLFLPEDLHHGQTDCFGDRSDRSETPNPS